MNASWEAIELRMQERGVGTLTRLAEISGVSAKSLTRMRKGMAAGKGTSSRGRVKPARPPCSDAWRGYRG